MLLWELRRAYCERPAAGRFSVDKKAWLLRPASVQQPVGEPEARGFHNEVEMSGKPLWCLHLLLHRRATKSSLPRTKPKLTSLSPVPWPGHPKAWREGPSAPQRVDLKTDLARVLLLRGSLHSLRSWQPGWFTVGVISGPGAPSSMVL